LCIDVEVVGAPTVREADGLALSSRNVHLGPQARSEAPALVRGLDAAERAVAAGERNREVLLSLVRDEIGRSGLAGIDYAELRDPDTLELAPPVLDRPALLALAVFFRSERPGGHDVRLIDNRVLRAGPSEFQPAVSEEIRP
jgi:pantoate--beta-alanine ligase